MLRSVPTATADEMFHRLCELMQRAVKELEAQGYDVEVHCSSISDDPSGERGTILITSGLRGQPLSSASYSTLPGGQETSLAIEGWWPEKSRLPRGPDESSDMEIPVERVFYAVKHPLHPAKAAWARSTDGGQTLRGRPFSGKGSVADSDELARIWTTNVTDVLVSLYS